MFGSGGILFNHAPQTHDKVIDRTTGNVGGVFPDVRLQASSREHDAIMFEEVSKQLLFPRCQRVNLAIVPQF